MSMENLDFSSFLDEKMRERGLTLKKISELTSIPLAHLENLHRGDLDELPSGPYLRGYLGRLGRILDFEPEIWWKHFEKDQGLTGSGGADKLPQNRFALRPLSKYAWFVPLAMILVIYLGFRFSAVAGRPMLELREPDAGISTSTGDSQNVSGSTDPGNRVFVNSEEVPVSPEGGFEKRVNLEPGLNSIRIEVRKFLGGAREELRQVIYKPAEEAPSATSSEE